MAEYIDRQLCETAADYDEHYRLIVPLSKIRKFPSADVEPVVHGKWIELEPEIALYACSCCNHNFLLRMNSNYCPNCGAKMDGGDACVG